MSDLSSFAVPDGESGIDKGKKRKEPEPKDGKGNKYDKSSKEGLDNKYKKYRQKQLEDDRYKRVKREEEVERRRIILECRSWATAFPKQVGDMVKNIEDMGLEEVIILRESIKTTVATRTTGIVTGAASTGGLILAEDLIDKTTGLQVKGPVARLSQLAANPDWNDLVKETTLEFSDWIYQHPLKRLIAYGIQQVAMLHNVNSSATENPKVKDRKFDDGKEDKPEATVEGDLQELRDLKKRTEAQEIAPPDKGDSRVD